MKLPAWTTTTKPSFTLISQPEKAITRKEEWVNVGVTLGDPRRNCSGSGICHIMGLGQLKPANCQGKQISGFLNLVDNRHLQLIFDGRQLSLQEKRKHFGDAKMLIRSNLFLPLEVSNILGVSEKTVISPGEYQIHRDGYYLHHYVRFKSLFVRA